MITPSIRLAAITGLSGLILGTALGLGIGYKLYKSEQIVETAKPEQVLEDLNVTVLQRLPENIGHLRNGLAALQARRPVIHETRQCGMIAGIELRRPDGSRFDPANRTGENVCLAARAHGLLTRPILDTIVLMPPLCATLEELDHALDALDRALGDVFPG